jgi:hypothetical protein
MDVSKVSDEVRDESGVDVSLIRWFLTLTPAERLDYLQEHVNAVVEIRGLNARE